MQQRCPRCKSDRIRHGYRHTPLLLKLVFRYNLLCDSCNWEFNGFAVPGTVPARTRRKKDKGSVSLNQDSLIDDPKDESGEAEFEDVSPSNNAETHGQETPEIRDIETDETAKKKKVKKRVKLRLN